MHMTELPADASLIDLILECRSLQLRRLIFVSSVHRVLMMSMPPLCPVSDVSAQLSCLTAYLMLYYLTVTELYLCVGGGERGHILVIRQAVKFSFLS